MAIKQGSVLPSAESKEEGQPYEYKPPSGRYVQRLFRWQVAVPWGSQMIRETVEADDATRALKKVLLSLAQKLNLQPSIVFARVQAAKKFTVELEK